MSILSEADFERLKATGMLYVVEPECDGTYASYLEANGIVLKDENTCNTKFQRFMKAFERLCDEHDVTISGFDFANNLQVWDRSTFKSFLFNLRIGDYTEEGCNG